jgi:endoglucanase
MEILSQTMQASHVLDYSCGVFAENDKVIFDCNNEPHDMSAISVVTGLMQACINGVRAAGATSQYIFVEGTSYSGAWTWFVAFLLYLLNLA